MKTLFRICFTSICNKLGVIDIYAPVGEEVLKSLIIIVNLLGVILQLSFLFLYAIRNHVSSICY